MLIWDVGIFKCIPITHKEIIIYKIFIVRIWDELKTYIKDKRTKEYEKKVSTLKTDKAKAGAKEKYDFDMIELEDILNTNKKLLGNLVRCLNAAAEIKMELWNGFKQSQQDYSTFYQSRRQGYKPADAEGISMSDSDGNIVKIVDRANFSANNRDADIVKGFEHESLDEESNNREFIETELFTRKWNKLGLDDGTLLKVQKALLNNPKTGKVIPGTKGARKIRFIIGNNKGKSGGGRIIYLDVLIENTIYLLDVYLKSDKENLNKMDKKRIINLINSIKGKRESLVFESAITEDEMRKNLSELDEDFLVEESIKKINEIKSLRAMNYSTKEIKEMLDKKYGYSGITIIE